MNELELRMQDVEREESLSDSALDNVEREGEPGLPDLQFVERRSEQLRHEAQMRPVRALRGKRHRLVHAEVESVMFRGLALVLVPQLAEAPPHFELVEFAGHDPARVLHREDLNCDVVLAVSPVMRSQSCQPNARQTLR